MILTGSEDLRVLKTIRAIKRAMKELLCEKDYQKITVKELCDRAQINKKTFYHYYNSQNTLLYEMQQELSAEFMLQIRDYVLPEDMGSIVREFFRFSLEKGLYCRKLMRSANGQNVIDQLVLETWKRSPFFNRLDEPRQRLLLTYVSTVSVSLLRQWDEEGQTIPLEEMIELTTSIIRYGLGGILR